MSAIGQVETFIADGEIGDFLIPERHSQTEPVMEGRIDDFASAELSILIGDGTAAVIAAPCFRDGDCEGVFAEFGGHAGAGRLLFAVFGIQDLEQPFVRGLDLGVADFRPCHDVTGEFGNGDGLGEGTLSGAGEIAERVDIQSGCTPGGSGETDTPRGFILNGPRVFETVQHGRGIEHKVERVLEFFVNDGEFFPDAFPEDGIDTVSDPAVIIDPSAETVAAEFRGEVQVIAADPSAEGRGGQICDVPGECAQVAHMIGDAFKFDGDLTEYFSFSGCFDPGEGFDESGVNGGSSGTGISGGGFHEREIPYACGIQDHFFDPAMLISQRDLQGIHFFAHTLEPEVSGFDDPGMNGPNGDFVNGIALHPEVIGDSGLCVFVMEPDGFEPGMFPGDDPVLFMEFPFEPMECGNFRRERRIFLFYSGGSTEESVCAADDCDKPVCLTVLRDREECENAFFICVDLLRKFLAEGVERGTRYVIERDDLAIPDRFHHWNTPQSL